ncbi:MAG: hypothetical protein MR517_04435, partial [Bacteroidales bacterium]|nr:hypothetical protein [Bacteroidales bacterium]
CQTWVNVAMLKIVIWGYSNCDKIPVCRVLKSGKHRDFFGKHPVFFGKQKNGLGKHVLDFWETFALILASDSAFGTCRTYTKN